MTLHVCISVTLWHGHLKYNNDKSIPELQMAALLILGFSERPVRHSAISLVNLGCFGLEIQILVSHVLPSVCYVTVTGKRHQ